MADAFRALGLGVETQEFPGIALAVNVDGVGLRLSWDTVSFYECGPEIRRRISTVLPGHPGIRECDPWYSGDHTLFCRKGVPCIAFSSADPGGVATRIIHTTEDTLAAVDPGRINDVARAIAEIVEAMAET